MHKNSSKKSIPHDSAKSHVTGQSEFIDDRPFTHNEVHVGLITSTIAHGKILNKNIKRALSLHGVVGIFDYKDLAFNRWGTIFPEQPLLVEDTCTFIGEPILVIAAESQDLLLKAKELIQIEYEPLQPILSIDSAIEHNQYIGPPGPPRQIIKGNIEHSFKSAPHILEGTLELAGQDHFYLESQASIAYPKELDQLEIHSSSQHPTEVQHVIAQTLGLKQHQVVCIVKRMGGAFGGKESQAAPYAAFAALVAHKTKRPARLVLTKDEDMISTGKRNPFKNYYKVAFNDEGKLLGLQVDLFSNGGAYADLTTAIMERAMLHCDNAYYIPNVQITGRVCRTNYPPNTAFRGFGGPKGVATIENIIEEIAQHLNRDALDIRKINVYRKSENHTTHYGQPIDQEMLPQLFEQLEKTSDYRKRRQSIYSWNQKDEMTLRGLSMTAVKFGISFTTRFLNQGNALVNLHMDGTLQVSTGATEMGQGANAKIAQVVAEEFGIDSSDVQLMPTSTEKNHNTSPTAASSGADINGSAAQVACKKIKKRLAELAIQLFEIPKDQWAIHHAALGTNKEIQLTDKINTDNILFQEGMVFDQNNPSYKISLLALIKEAYLNRISLGAYGYYRYPNIHFNKIKGTGNPFYYFTNGVAASEVSIDRFTGEMKVLRTDILMDLGRPINDVIDRGQITGAFIQGMGWVTTENLHYDETGRLHSISPSTYKIPSVQDIPRIFNIDLIYNDENIKNLKANKAVGEPPLLLCLSVWNSIKNALSYVKKTTLLKLPATQEEILSHLPEITLS